MAEIKGLVYNNDSVEFITPNGGTITGDLNIEGDLVIDGEVIGPEPSGPTIVDFANGTIEEITAMLEAHYNGEIDIADYWQVGDERMIHLNAMSSGTGGETHAAQEMTMVIIGVNHDTLETAINNRTTAAVTLQCREALGNKGSIEKGTIHSDPNNAVPWTRTNRRAWLNDQFVSSLPTNVQSLLKTVVKKNVANNNTNTAGTSTKDKAFLLSVPELFGNNLNSYSTDYYKGNTTLEGNQYPYFNTTARRHKYANNNGSPSGAIQNYWTRSLAYGGSFHSVRLYSGGIEQVYPDDQSRSEYAIVPAFCW